MDSTLSISAEMRAALADSPSLEPEFAEGLVRFPLFSPMGPNPEKQTENEQTENEHETGEIGPDKVATALLFPSYSTGFTESPEEPETFPASSDDNHSPVTLDTPDEEESSETPGTDCSTVRLSETPSPLEQGLETPKEETFGPYKALKQRRHSESADPEVFFSPDVRLSPFEATSGVFKVLKSNPQLRDPCVRQGYTLVSHGFASHAWSLMPDTTTGDIVRPLATFETPCYHLGSGYATVNDMKSLVAIRLMLFGDTAVSNHLEFMKCDAYRYEWRSSDDDGVAYLWQYRLVDGQKRPAALLRQNTKLFKSPVNNSTLWSVEVDIDRIDPILAFLSAFCLMRRGPSLSLNSFLANDIAPTPPQPLVNVVFEDEGRILQRASKFYGDWDAEVEGRQLKTHTVKVFSVDYLKRYKLPDIVLRAINKEATDEIMALRMQFGIYYV